MTQAIAAYEATPEFRAYWQAVLASEFAQREGYAAQRRAGLEPVSRAIAPEAIPHFAMSAEYWQTALSLLAMARETAEHKAAFGY